MYIERQGCRPRWGCCAHKGSTQSAAAAAAAWPGKNVTTQLIPLATQRPPGANTIHNQPSHWTTRNGEEEEGEEGGAVSQCCMAVSHSTTADKQHAAADRGHSLLLGFLVLPVEFHFVHQMQRILRTVLEEKRNEKRGGGHRSLRHTQFRGDGLWE